MSYIIYDTKNHHYIYSISEFSNAKVWKNNRLAALEFDIMQLKKVLNEMDGDISNYEIIPV